jgi:hypothetical protein
LLAHNKKNLKSKINKEGGLTHPKAFEGGSNHLLKLPPCKLVKQKASFGWWSATQWFEPSPEAIFKGR